MSFAPSRKNIFFMVVAFLLLTLYRVIPFRPMGFAPQLAISFCAGYFLSGSMQQKWLLPLLSMFVSDAVYALLHALGYTELIGFYGVSQFVNYAFILSLVYVGIWSKKQKPRYFFIGSIFAATFYFLLSNLYVWCTYGGYVRVHTVQSLLQCYIDGLPFYGNSLLATCLFSSLAWFVHFYWRLKTIETN